MSPLDRPTDQPSAPAVHAVAAPVDAPTQIVSDTDAEFSDWAAARAATAAAEKGRLLAEGAIEPELIDQPIGDLDATERA